MGHNPSLNYFTESHGPASHPTLWLDWTFTAIVCAVCVAVAMLLVGALFHSRPPVGETVADPHGKALNWIYVGTGISTLILIGMAIHAVIALNAVADPPTAPALAIKVTGYDWWWSADYGDFTTANEIHIPTGVPVRVDLASADVIHAFWVPQLAGKTQMVPGRANQQWLQADTPGVYRGQCTQFCGLQHAHMAFEIVAQSPADFAVWRAAQARPAAPAGDSGETLFVANCGGCHTVRGTTANGTHAPDLTHLMSRRMLAADTLDNTPRNLALWVAKPQTVKPGANMPDSALSEADLGRIVTYLGTLK